MSRHAGAGSVRRPSRKRPSSSPSSSTRDSSDVPVDEVLLDDPTEEERIEAEIMGHLFRGAAPEAYQQAVAQQQALRAKKAALRREAAETRAQRRRLRAYTDLLLKTDVSGYSEQQAEEYRRELQRRSNECFAQFGTEIQFRQRIQTAQLRMRSKCQNCVCQLPARCIVSTFRN